MSLHLSYNINRNSGQICRPGYWRNGSAWLSYLEFIDKPRLRVRVPCTSIKILQFLRRLRHYRNSSPASVTQLRHAGSKKLRQSNSGDIKCLTWLPRCRGFKNQIRGTSDIVMPFSYHSHSGQFCGHAKNTLEEMIQTAVKSGMEVYALTEHMPRDQAEDLYPEEIEASETPASLSATFEAYISEAARLRTAYKSKINILIGMEIDWIRPSSKSCIQQLLKKYSLDLFVGSVHHVHTIPIDYDHEMYRKARAESGGTDEDLFSDYFDAQYEMLKELKPPIVGHFDLIRLESDEPDANLMRWNTVWQKVLRNLSFISQYGGILELNSAALRKGLSEPYPTAEICKAFVVLDGRFTFSDDSHGIDQVGLNYDKVLAFAEDVGIRNISGFSSASSSAGSLDSQGYGSSMSLADMRKHLFFQKRQSST